ncbi:MAG: hypothetical protein DRP51_02605 [Candidatus Zixiibacteriota bacterium]|nr:MAG: hypothetical protein DRP51_02605 [candidate division Zixibacteria bacterium]
MKKINQLGLTFTILFLLIMMSNDVSGRARYDIDHNRIQAQKISADNPYVSIGVHRVGRLGLTVVNMGQIGTGFAGAQMDPRDPSRVAPSAIYPYPGNNSYLFAGAFWIGAIVGRDTLVSVGADGWSFIQEMYPDPYPKGEVIFRTLSNPSDLDAVSEEDFIMMYTDTVTNPAFVASDPIDGRPHVPLNIEVNQRSYAWSYSYAEDFVLFDMSIKNIGNRVLNQFYMGMYVDGDVGSINGTGQEFTDDICGFRRDIDSPFGCGWVDTINIAWISDNNGLDDSNNQDECPYGPGNYTGVNGMRVVRTPSDSLQYSFNWWISNGSPAFDFGPRMAGTEDDPFRDFGGFLGTPEGDRNKYYVLSHEEFDYDQLFCAKDNTVDGWLERGPDSDNFADGFDTRYLLSFGPFDISPGEVLPLTFAYVAGDNFFSDCEAYNNFNRYAPEEYYNTLNFEEIGLNSIWASMIYDNPGVDTDGDGYRGKYRVCIESTQVSGEWTYNYDTVYYKGDNVPDFKGASPPPPPELWVINPYPLGDTIRSLVTPHVTETNNGEVTIQWYGYRSETTRDPFSGEIDFEGYRVYISLTEELLGYYEVCTYDKEDYNRYIFNPFSTTTGREWELNDLPFTIDELKELYGESFNPNDYPRDRPFYWDGNSYYFAAQDWNQYDLTDTTLIHKIYPSQPPPTTLDHDSAWVYYRDEMTDEGYFKYYMYEYKVTNLLPSQLYYFAVTAFDFGSPSSDLASLETRPNKNYIAEYPQNQNTLIESGGLNVVVYPNPYRGDANYKDIGFFEGRGLNNPPDERIRRIHFTNLPHKCTIRIFSIDGDLIRKIEHDEQKDFPQSMHEEWDLITRNTQMVVSGIYYYSIESEYGSQVGKLVIIL